MHELSIAKAIIDQVRENAPKNTTVQTVYVVAGPMRAIDPIAMEWAWLASTDGTDLEGSQLDMELSPWMLHCPKCERTFTADDMFESCTCGYSDTELFGGDELTLMSIEVKEVTPPCKSPS